MATRIEEARAALEAGDAHAAFGAIRPALEFPATLAGDAWRDALSVFADVAQEIAGAGLADKVRAAEGGVDVEALHALGYDLLEHGLAGVAATVLARASAIAPSDRRVLSELVAAHERRSSNADAVAALRAAPDEVMEDSFLLRYLLGFNALATGDVEGSAAALATLVRPEGDTEQFLRGTLRGMHARLDALRATGAAPLDARDLRGWTFVMNGALLLHRSSHGEETMGGRYAYVQDSPRLCRLGIDAARAALAALGVRPERVLAPADRGSQVLARATARALDLPLVDWPSGGLDLPGLVVAYDLAQVDEDAWRALVEHRPGQVLWAHTLCWTEPRGYVPDLVTFLHQHNVAPWGEQLRLDPATNQVARATPDDAPADALAGEVLAAPPEEDAPAERAALESLARSGRGLAPDATPGALRTTGRRRRYYAEAPVPWARFG